jgi:hypothetical protein
MTDQEKPQENSEAFWVISPENPSGPEPAAALAFSAEELHRLEENQPAAADQPAPISPAEQDEMVALTDSSISEAVRPETPPTEPEESSLVPASPEGQPPAAADTHAEPAPPAAPSPAVSSAQPERKSSAPAASQEARPPVFAAPLPPLNRRELFVWVSATSLMTLLLTLAITLGILSNLNGGLKYVSPEQHNLLTQQVDALNTQVTALQKDVQGLRDRLDNVEKLSGRVTTLEKSTDTLRSQVDDSTQKVTEMKKQLTGIDSTLESLQTRGESYDNFFTGLRDQINQLLNKLKLP